MRPVTLKELAKIYPHDAVGTFPVIAYAGYLGRRRLGVGGLAWNAGVCWLWIDVHDLKRTYPVHVVRWARRMLKVAEKYGDLDVFAARDEFPRSEKLLNLLGFKRLPGTVGGKEIWQRSPQLPPSQQSWEPPSP